jgi:hypothetical protein
MNDFLADWERELLRGSPEDLAAAIPGVCGHVKSTGRITWICTAPTGPPPGQKRGPHIHYYRNRNPSLNTQENPR